MSASEVGLLAQQVVEFDTEGDAVTAVDLTDISDENRAMLHTCVAEYRSAGRRVVSELLTMTEQLVKIQEIVGGRRFYPFVRNELGLSKRTLSRYLHLNKVLQQHFAIEGKVPLSVTNAISSRALEMLSPETDESVIQEVRSVIDSGGKIDSRTVETILAKREADHAAALASARADAHAATRSLDRSRDQHAVELARAQRELSSQTELLRRAEQTGQILEEENAALRRQSTEVRFEEKRVEIVPPGYSTIQEAIDSKRGELSDLTAREESTARSLAALEEQRRVMEAKLTAFNASVGHFIAMKDQVDTLISAFPLAVLKEMAAGDKNIGAALSALGKTMTLFGEQLQAAA
jgi:phospholipid N-methyltransferase